MKWYEGVTHPKLRSLIGLTILAHKTKEELSYITDPEMLQEIEHIRERLRELKLLGDT